MLPSWGVRLARFVQPLAERHHTDGREAGGGGHEFAEGRGVGAEAGAHRGPRGAQLELVRAFGRGDRSEAGR
jgi:hypothetical protein